MPYIEVEFEVFRGTCGKGLCGQTSTRQSRNRHIPQVTVDVCKSCIDDATAALEASIDDLKEQLRECRKQEKHTNG
jgi:predicted metal-binding protein